ncbi:MAG: MBL fold metallo-hydrolase [Parcubacteria group bacterium]|nr:MBL fold metallo-hydrolase [Parcubacteria group bacterium]
MIITYYGGQFFKIQQGDLTIAYNPVQEPQNTGEYETKGVYVRGLETFTKYGGGDQRLNTIYYLLLEGIGLGFLGALDSPQLGEKIYDAMPEVDILFVPIGGDGVLSPAEAHKLSLSFSPKVIIPMQYDAETLKKFLLEAGQEDEKPQEKVTFKKKDLEGKEGEVAVLKIS